MNKLFITLILGIFLISFTSGYYVYQETANVSVGAGTSNTGSYYLENWSTAFSLTRGYDGDWNTIIAATSGMTAKFYVNYTKPTFISTNSIWVVKYYNSSAPGFGTINNLIIPDDCMNYNVSKVSLFLNMTGSDKGFSNAFYCYNGTWKALLTYSGVGSGLYEEAMNWNTAGIEYNVSYNTSVYETSRQNFNLNLSYNPEYYSLLLATLYYNGTAYSTTKTESANNVLFNTQFDIPITATQINRSFYWQVSLYNGTEYEYYNTSTYNQTVNNITLTQCTTGTRTLNYTFYDEQNKTKLQNFTFDATFQYSAGGTTKKTLSVTNSTITEVNLCINVNTTYYIDAIIAYSKSGYTLRNWFYQNLAINNVTRTEKLYSLLDSASTSFILQVQDDNLQPLRNVLVEAQRCYVGTNSNETVFIHRTDTSGLTIGNFEAETALYQFFITNNSNILLEVSPCFKIVPQTVPYTLLFQLGEDYVSPFNSLTDAENIVSTFDYNNDTQSLTWTYIDTSGNFIDADLEIYNLNMSGNNALFCYQNSTVSGAILTCNMSVAGTYSANAYVNRNNEVLYEQYVFTVETRSSVVGYYGVFLTIFLLIIGAFTFKFNEIAGIILLNVIVIFANVVGLVNFGPVFITAMLGLSAIIIGVLER
jgi:hypothetical protein